MFTGILNTLAEVRLRRTATAHNCCGLTYELLVIALDNNSVRVGGLEGDTVVILKGDGVRITEIERERLTCLLGSVTYAYDLSFFS